MNAVIDISNPVVADIERIVNESHSRDATIAAIKYHLKKRTGITFSVRGGQGTSWGWIRIRPMPAKYGTPKWDDDMRALAKALGYAESPHYRGEDIPASTDHRRVYLYLAMTGTPGPYTAEQYWD